MRSRPLPVRLVGHRIRVRVWIRYWGLATRVWFMRLDRESEQLRHRHLDLKGSGGWIGRDLRRSQHFLAEHTNVPRGGDSQSHSAAADAQDDHFDLAIN